MAKPGHYQKKFLDGRMLFYRYYVEMGKGGSYEKLARALYSEGVYNEITGKGFTDAAIYFAIWRWALEHLEEALPIMKDYDRQFGIFRSEEEWRDRILRNVNQPSIFTKNRRKKFFEEHPEYARA